MSKNLFSGEIKKNVRTSFIFWPTNLNFCIDISNDIEGMSCREIFEDDYWEEKEYNKKFNRKFCIFTGASKSSDGRLIIENKFKNVVKTIDFIEKTLCLKGRTKFKHLKQYQSSSEIGISEKSTTLKGMGVVFTPTKFWVHDQLRFSFLTALIKGTYKKDEVWNQLKNMRNKENYPKIASILKAIKYFQNTCATKRFLKGFTVSKYKQGDWQDTFEDNESVEDVKDVLRKRK